MRHKNYWLDDPVVREVRRIREQLWREGGGTIDGLIDLLNQQARSKARRSSSKIRREK